VHALAGDEQTVAEGLDGVEEGLGLSGEVFGEACLAVAVEDDEEQIPGVQIDAGIESMQARVQGVVNQQKPLIQELDALLPAILDRAFQGEL